MLTPQERRRLWKHGFVVVGMFTFAFALAPMYQAFCEITGWGGVIEGASGAERAAQMVAAGNHGEISERTVQFMMTAEKERRASVEFSNPKGVRDITPGKLFHAAYAIKNTADEAKVFRATFRLSPGEAGGYVKKLYCFCWDDITLQPGEEKQLPLQMIVSPDLPRRIGYLTLHYTVYDQDKAPQKARAGTKASKTHGLQ